MENKPEPPPPLLMQTDTRDLLTVCLFPQFMMTRCLQARIAVIHRRTIFA